MIGSVLQNKYRILELLGEGGMGVVYKALDEELNRPVALKLLKGEFTDNPQFVKRFHDETRVLASFNHANITTIYSRFDWNGQPVMVMELLDGETFSAMIARRGPIPAETCVPWFEQALAGVGEAHKHGIIHRDLKPANLLLTRSGSVKVMDFGIAKIEQTLGMTRTSTVIGTPYYMSPEQVEPTRFGLQHLDSRTDIYSMGVTLYELLAGAVPFQGVSEFAIQRAHLEETPQPPTIYYPHIPPHIVEAVLKAMAKDPRDRFQHAEDFAEELARVPRASRAQDPTTQKTIPTKSADTGLDEVRPTRENAGLEHGVPTSGVLDRSPEKSFGFSGKPRPIAASLAFLAVVLIVGGGFAAYMSLSHTREEAVNHSAYSSGEGGSAPGHFVPREPGNAESHEAESRSIPAPPSANIGVSVPSPKSPAATNAPILPPLAPTAPTQSQGIARAPTPHLVEEPLVAGHWSGSFRSCENTQNFRARLNLTESRGSDASKLYVGGQILVASASGTQSCQTKGTFSKTNNRLTLWTSCGGISAPDFLAAPHASVLSLYQNQMSGTILPDNPCMTIQFSRE